MRVLGLSFGYHDSSVALIEDSEVIMSLAEERSSRQKHDPNFPRNALGEILRQNSLTIADIDHVVFHEDPFNKFTRVLASSLSRYPYSYKEFSNSIKSWIGNKIWAVNTICSELNIDESQVSYFNHHFSHAVQAFMGSGFKESAILVVDAVGDWSSTGMYQGRWTADGPEIEPILEIQFPNSLGLVYSTFTSFLGFVPNDSECSTMAIAGFGSPSYLNEIQKIVPKTSDGLYSVDPKYFNFSKFYSRPYTKKFEELFGKPRDPAIHLKANCFLSQQNDLGDEQRFYDIAASIQAHLEDILQSMTKRLKLETNSTNLCYAGGVAMNCVANSKILNSGIFENIYIPPDPGDGGTSIGTALFYSAKHSAQTAPKSYPVYVGSEYNEDFEFLDKLDATPFEDYRVADSEGCPSSWSVKKLAAPELIDEVSQYIAEGKIVGWFQGKCEVGPRALGARSILARPDKVEIAKRLSLKIKKRAFYRPYAISITDDDAEKVLQLRGESKNYRWMQYAIPVKDRQKIIAATHVDGTTRAQICHRSKHPYFYDLLVGIGKKTGLSATLNTSFNLSGYPLVEKPIDAILIFARSDMDILVIGNTIFKKV